MRDDLGSMYIFPGVFFVFVGGIRGIELLMWRMGCLVFRLMELVVLVVLVVVEAVG